MTRKLVEIAADIVQAQVSTNPMSSDEIVSSLRHVFQTLQEIQESEADLFQSIDTTKQGMEGRYEPAIRDKMNPKESIQEDKIVCLECGMEMRQLTAKHLGAHDMSPREYRLKWGIPLKQSLSAKSLSRSRSKAAKKRGLPENLVKFQEQRRLKKAQATSQEGGTPSKAMAEEKIIRRPHKSKSE